MKNERWVDGFNVLHCFPHLADRLGDDPEGAREDFLRMLAPLALRGGEKWTVIFDGPRGERDRAPGPIDLVFCRDADAWILNALRRHARPRQVTVVSSDEKDIGREAREMGARVESAASLAGKLRKRRAVRPAPEKPDQETAEGVEYWLDRFDASGDEPDSTKD